jgi:hypothetical protein
MRYVQRVFEAFGLGVTDFHPHPIAPDGDHLSKLGNRELVFRVIYCVQFASQVIDKSKDTRHLASGLKGGLALDKDSILV